MMLRTEEVHVWRLGGEWNLQVPSHPKRSVRRQHWMDGRFQKSNLNISVRVNKIIGFASTEVYLYPSWVTAVPPCFGCHSEVAFTKRSFQNTTPHSLLRELHFIKFMVQELNIFTNVISSIPSATSCASDQLHNPKLVLIDNIPTNIESLESKHPLHLVRLRL